MMGAPVLHGRWRSCSPTDWSGWWQCQWGSQVGACVQLPCHAVLTWLAARQRPSCQQRTGRVAYTLQLPGGPFCTAISAEPGQRASPVVGPNRRLVRSSSCVAVSQLMVFCSHLLIKAQSSTGLLGRSDLHMFTPHPCIASWHV